MRRFFKSHMILTGLLTLGAGVAPTLAQMAPMGPRGAGSGMPGGMEGKLPMPGAAAQGTPGMPPAAIPSSPMGDDRMAVPPQSAAAPGMPGMPPGAAPPRMTGGEMMPGMMERMKPMMDTMMGQMAKMQPPLAAPLDHVEGRIAYMKAELAVTDAQAPAWDKFAAALRTSRGHLDEARMALVASKDVESSVPNRLEAYEHHLSMRLDSLRSARESFQVLYASLTPTQKVSADELAGPLLASF